MAALVALVSPSALAGALALHLTTHDHHEELAQRDTADGVDLALHGHAHGDATLAHGHPLLIGAPASIPGRLLLSIGAMVGDLPEIVVAPVGVRGLVSPKSWTHDPPRRPDPPSVLRI